MFECKVCGSKHERFKTIEGLYSHLERVHSDEIPAGWSVQQYAYYIKTGKTHGNCVICKGKTKFNPATGKYYRLCEKKACSDKNREIFKERMIGKYGKVSLLDDPEQQKKMLANRKISGTYTWSDGKKFTYTGSYELDFLKFLDVFLNFPSQDVECPSPHTYYYEYEGKKHFYIPDVYIQSLNLEIEVKDGGNNPNTHHKIQEVDKIKETLKDKVMLTQNAVSYVKVTNKEYDTFFKYLYKMKDQYNDKNDDFKPIFILGESSVFTDYSDIVLEASDEEIPDTQEYMFYVSNEPKLKTIRATNSKSVPGSDKVVIASPFKEFATALGVNLSKDHIKMVSTFTNGNLNIEIELLDKFAPVDNKFSIYVLSKDGFEPMERNGEKSKVRYYKKGDAEVIREIKVSNWRRYVKRFSKVKLINFPNDEEAKEIAKKKLKENAEETILESTMSSPYYFLSKTNMDNKTLKPRVPENYLTRIGAEDSTTPRVCLSDSIGGCLTALSMNLEGVDLFVHVPTDKINVRHPSLKEVPDANCTGEVWCSEPVTLKCIGKIHVNKATTPMKYKYNKNGKMTEAETYSWDWKWVEHVRENLQEEYSDFDPVTEAYKRKPPKIITKNLEIDKQYGIYGNDEVYNAIVELKGINFKSRGRSEMLVIKDDMVYLSKSKSGELGNYSLPGGGWEPNESHDESAVRETREETRMHTKNVVYGGNYLAAYDEPNSWVKNNVEEKFQWRGYYTEVYIGEYDGIYTGHIDEVDKDDIIKTGKFYPIQEVKKLLNPIHLDIINRYLKGEIGENLNESYVIKDKNTLYYRVTYNGNGIYEEFKNACDFDEWKRFKKSKACNWLPLPPEYKGDYRSYFTKKGFEMFKKYTLPEIEKKLDSEKIDIERINTKLDIVYQDDYQVVSETADIITKYGTGEIPRRRNELKNYAKFNTDSLQECYQSLELSESQRRNLESSFAELLGEGRDATNEEVQCVTNYIDSISESTEIDFWDLLSDVTEDDIDLVTESTTKSESEFNKLNFKNPKELSDWMKRNIRYKNYDKLMTPEEVFDSKKGSCHDQVMFEDYFFKKMGIPHGKIFLIEYNEGEQQGGTTHSFIYYKDKNKFYWFENAWSGQEGINGPYDSLNDLKDDVKEKTLKNSRYKNVEFSTVKNVESGMSLGDFVSSCLNESVESELVTEEAIYSSTNKYPVFIVLMHSGTTLANAIKAFTKDEFSHACISFNSKLDPLYSFGNKKVNIIDPGFVIQNSKSDFYKKHKAYYNVFVMYVDKASYNKMKEKLQYFIDNKDDLKYDLASLFKIANGKPSEESKKYFCSKFCMNVIGAGRELEKVPSLWKPEDIKGLDDISLVDKGVDFSLYDYRETEKNLEKIKKQSVSSIQKESTLTTEERKDISNSDFGIPVLKKYPIPDEEHVRSAIRFFNYVDEEYEELLAENIKKKIKEFNMEVNVGKKNRLSKYL